jgi:hypothetical protein
MKLRYMLLLLACMPVTRAIGPSLPLQFEDERYAGRNWYTAVQVDLAQLAPPTITREIYRSGERIADEKLPVKLPELQKYEGAQRVELPLRAKSMSRLKDGAYAQRIVVESAWRNKENPPLRIERWFYFQVRDRKIVPLSPEEYERLTDPPQKNTASPDAVERVYLGGGRTEDMPLSKTKRTPAIRADSIDAINEEQPPEAAKSAVMRDETPDRSEEREP